MQRRLDYLRERETATWYVIADDWSTSVLDCIRICREECRDTDDIRYLFKSMLLRELYYFVPNGIRRPPLKLHRATSHWASTFVEVCTDPHDRPLTSFDCDVVSISLNDTSLPDDWLPSSCEDPDFAALFEQSKSVEKLRDSSIFQEVKRRETQTWEQFGREWDVHPRLVMNKAAMEIESEADRDYLLKSSLVRLLHQFAPDGIKAQTPKLLADATSQWRVYSEFKIFPRKDLNRIDALCRRVADALENDDALPDDWLPQSADDPQLLALFDDAAG